eukprot:c20448_g1_i1.p1 GENE.c20448_g1_i1~~c20448_g1_i1.p1  ORF type:complete len:583 (+),score=171.25 c20448_g1_i1:8-1756(+)
MEEIGTHFFSFLETPNSSDYLGRITLSLVAILYTINFRKNNLKNWIITLLFCSLIVYLGSLFFLPFICLSLLKNKLNLTSSSFSISFPKFKLNADSVSLSILTFLGVYTRCVGLSDLAILIFDEVHFGKFLNGHITGEFYFDIHPPIIKLIMAGFIKYFAPYYHGEQEFEDIGSPYFPTSPVKAMRFIPAFSSALLVPVVYLTCREIGVSWMGSLVCASMCLFDNLLVTEGRILTTDTSLVLFLALALYFHLRTENSQLFSRKWFISVILTGVFMGLTVSAKWISLNIVGVVGVCTAVDILGRGHLGFSFKYGFDENRVNLKDFFFRLFFLLVVPAAIYVLSFYLWLETTPRWSENGPAFMPTAFQASLINSPVKYDGEPPTFWDNFVSMNHGMFTGNRDVGKGQKGHHWESWWYQWPLDLRGLACWASGVKYYSDKGMSLEHHVYFLGNPFVWWFAAMCLTFVPIVIFSPRKIFNPIPNYNWKIFLLLLGYFSGILPYVAVRRSCFIYHYLVPLHFLTIVCGIVLDHLVFKYFNSHRIDLFVGTILIAVFAWSFWFFGVFTYGTLISKPEYEARIWRDGWR